MQAVSPLYLVSPKSAPFPSKIATPMHLISFLSNISAITLNLATLSREDSTSFMILSFGYVYNCLMRSINCHADICCGTTKHGPPRFVGNSTSASFFPAACKPFERAFSEAPLPYISAVSNQLIPPSREREMTLLMTSSSSEGRSSLPCFFGVGGGGGGGKKNFFPLINF